MGIFQAHTGAIGLNRMDFTLVAAGACERREAALTSIPLTLRLCEFLPNVSVSQSVQENGSWINVTLHYAAIT